MATIKLHHWDYDKKETVEDGEVTTGAIARCVQEDELVSLFDDLLNYGGRGYLVGKNVGDKFRTHHRTIQRSAIAFCMGVLVGISEQEHSDARNATALETAKKIKQMFDDGELQLGAYI